MGEMILRTIVGWTVGMSLLLVFASPLQGSPLPARISVVILSTGTAAFVAWRLVRPTGRKTMMSDVKDLRSADLIVKGAGSRVTVRN